MSQPSTRPTLYKGYRFPPEIIGRCVWLSYRFGVSLRDASELMLARRIEVSPHVPLVDALGPLGSREPC
jgi:transposase-like protein